MKKLAPQNILILHFCECALCLILRPVAEKTCLRLVFSRLQTNSRHIQKIQNIQHNYMNSIATTTSHYGYFKPHTIHCTYTCILYKYLQPASCLGTTAAVEDLLNGFTLTCEETSPNPPSFYRLNLILTYLDIVSTFVSEGKFLTAIDSDVSHVL